jgi:hypothetical protein
MGVPVQRALTTALVLVALGGERAAAQTKTGTTILGFLGIEPSARFAAMGNAGVSVPDDIQAIHANPGALGWMSRGAVQFTHGIWFADIQYDYVAAAILLGNWGNASIAVTSLRSGDIDVRTVQQPLGTGERYTVRDVSIGLGYGRQITQRFAAGVQVEWASETIWHSGVDVLTASLGTIYRLSDGGLSLGASLLNVGTRGRFDGDDFAIQYDANPDEAGDNSTLPASQFTDEFAVPVLFRVGLSYPRQVSARSRLLISADAVHPSDNTESLDLGWEWTWRDTLAIRGGYQSLYQRDSEFGLTTGVGVRAGAAGRRFQVDYAWAYHGFLQDVHRFTFQVQL